MQIYNVNLIKNGRIYSFTDWRHCNSLLDWSNKAAICCSKVFEEESRYFFRKEVG